MVARNLLDSLEAARARLTVPLYQIPQTGTEVRLDVVIAQLDALIAALSRTAASESLSAGAPAGNSLQAGDAEGTDVAAGEGSDASHPRRRAPATGSGEKRGRGR